MSEVSSHEKLKNTTSLREVLEIATRFEQTARDFYADLTPKVRKNIRYLVEELAQEENRHYNLFTEMATRDDLEQQLQQEIQRPASDGKFSDCIHLPDLGDAPDDQAVLQYALMREHAAMEQYQALADNTEAGALHDLFLYLANEETKHKNELEKVYYETVHSGGV